MKPIKLWRDAARTLGAWNGSLYLVSKTLSKLTARRSRLVKYYLTAQPMTAGEPSKLRPDPRTVIRWVAEHEALCSRFPRPPAVIARRYRQGARCLAALVDGEFAGFIWLQRVRYEEDEVRCSYVLPDPMTTIWDFDVYIEPRFRLGRTFARLWDAANQHLAAEGVRWSFSRISAFNAHSLAAHRRLHTEIVGSLLFAVAGKRQMLLWSTGVGVERPTSVDAAPVVTFRAHSPRITGSALSTRAAR